MLVTVVTYSISDDRATVVLTWWLTTVPTMQHGSPEENDDEKHFGFKIRKNKQGLKKKKKTLGTREPMKRGLNGDVIASRTLTNQWQCSVLVSPHCFLFFTRVNHQTSPSNHLLPAHMLTSFPAVCLFIFFFTFELLFVRFCHRNPTTGQEYSEF